MIKTYFRLLSFAKPIEKYAIPYIIVTLFAVLFGTLNLVLLAPLLDTLFSDPAKNAAALVKPESYWDIMKMFDYYTHYVTRNYGEWTTLKMVCGVIAISVFLSNLFKYLSQRIMENLRLHTLLNLRKTVFNNVMDLHLGFFSEEKKGDIMSKVSSDVQVVQYTVTNTLQVIFKEPLQLIFYIVSLFLISTKLTLVSIMVIPISAFLISVIVRRLRQQAKDAQESYGSMIGYLDEALGGIKIIKAFNATTRIKKRFHDENVKFSNLTRSMANRQQMASPVSETLGVLMVTAIVLYGGYLILNHNSALSAQSFIAYIGIFSQISGPAKSLGNAFSGIHSGIAAGVRVLELIDTPSAIKDKPNAQAITEFKNEIKLQNIHFSYQEKPVLQNLTIDIKKGETVALVGPSGGGKSTTIDLIPRFIEPQQGEISIDGTNIQDFTLESLRALIGVVNQESILFNDSIYNNIAFGKPDASPEEIEIAAKIANAHDFIMETEQGYQTNIGDRGNKLSGGQKQRICIARAVLANPPIMLLDEATSALDTESEKWVQDALTNLMKNRTSIVIAHRLSTIQNADKIIVIEQGKVLEQGTHSELMAQNGLYQKLITMQDFK